MYSYCIILRLLLKHKEVLIGMIDEESLSVEVEKGERRETSTLTVRVTSGLLDLIDKAVEASEGKYVTRTDLVRDAIEFFSRHVTEGGLKQSKVEETEESSKKDLEHEANVEEALQLIKELEETSIEAVEELASVSEEKALPKSVWSDDRVQKSMRKALRDEIYPAGFWDGTRRFRRRKAREYVEALRKPLAIPRSAAKQLVENPDFQGEQYEEWD
jgi:Arc/MetJ-type ribon-helix-helix transcriptional regulator